MPSKGLIIAFIAGILLATFVTSVPAMIRKVNPL